MSVFKNVVMDKELQLPVIENGSQVLFSHRRTYCSNKILMWYPKVNQSCYKQKEVREEEVSFILPVIPYSPSAATEGCLERNPVYAVGDFQNTSWKPLIRVWDKLLLNIFIKVSSIEPSKGYVNSISGNLSKMP